jgi:hypothetical protein
MTLLCFCPDERYCHRSLVKEMILSMNRSFNEGKQTSSLLVRLLINFTVSEVRMCYPRKKREKYLSIYIFLCKLFISADSKICPIVDDGEENKLAF